MLNSIASLSKQCLFLLKKAVVQNCSWFKCLCAYWWKDWTGYSNANWYFTLLCHWNCLLGCLPFIYFFNFQWKRISRDGLLHSRFYRNDRKITASTICFLVLFSCPPPSPSILTTQSNPWELNIFACTCIHFNMLLFSVSVLADCAPDKLQTDRKIKTVDF